MPRVVPYDQKEKWFEESEKGSSVAKLANFHKRDPRTIQRGIEEVRNRRLTAQVRIEVLREGLRKHQEVLLETLSKAAAAIAPMPLHIEEIYHFNQGVPALSLEGLDVLSSEDGYAGVELDVQQDFLWQLIRQHLGKIKAFTYLSRWKSAVVEELNARLTLKGLVMEGITSEVGLTISEDPTEAHAIRPEAVYELIKGTFSIALEEGPAYAIDIYVDEAGVMRINDGTKGGNRNADGRTHAIKHLVEKIACGETAQDLRGFHREVTDAARRARQAFLEIAMSYYISGHCASCGKYSL